jgi:hypothetical protein
LSDVKSAIANLSIEEFLCAWTFLNWLEATDKIRDIFAAGIGGWSGDKIGNLKQNATFLQFDPAMQQWITKFNRYRCQK